MLWFSAKSSDGLGPARNPEESANASPDFLDQLASSFAISRNEAREMLGNYLAEEGRSREKSRREALTGGHGFGLR